LKLSLLRNNVEGNILCEVTDHPVANTPGCESHGCNTALVEI
jgi:hypothetical protein